jgi:hypothetical protein
VAEDKGGPPLPRRVPGTKRGPGTGPLTRPVLSDSDLQRIRAALDSAQAEPSAPPAELSAPPAELSAPLPQRVPDVGNGSEPPAHRPELPAAFLPTRSKKARKESPPAVPAPRPGGVAEETGRQPDAAAQPGPAAAPSAGPPLVPAQRAPAEKREERQDQPAEEKASPEREPASREKAPAVPKNEQAGLGKAQLHRTRALARHPKPAAPETPPPLKPAPPKSRPPTAPPSPPVSAGPRKRGRGRAIITGSAIATLVLLSAGSALLLTRHAGTANASPDASTANPSPGASTKIAVRDRAADWVANQVGRGGLISCDRAMCQALHTRGVPADDLVVLKRGGVGPLHSAVVVVTAAVKRIVGSQHLAAEAPAALASFGSGAGRIVIGMVFPRGAAAYAAALRNEITDRKTAGTSLLLLGPITASAVGRQELQGGQVDSRLLLTLAELASQWPVSIMAFGDRGPGASLGIPFRSADLVVTGAKAGLDPAGQAQLMSDFVHQLGDFFPSARIETVQLASGRRVVQIGFTAPSPFGLLRTR